MWVVAGVLIAAMALTVLAGFHTGPHTHLVGSAIGALAAIWLIVMAAQGRDLALIIVLLVLVVLVAVVIGVLAWKGLTSTARVIATAHSSSLEGAVGSALSDLDPEGIVRVRGETWSAKSLNGVIAKGDEVQVITATGVYLEVWGEGSATPSEITNPPDQRSSQ